MNALRELTGGDAEFERELVETFVTSGDQCLAEILDGAARPGLRHHRQACPCPERRERQYSRLGAGGRRLEPGERGARRIPPREIDGLVQELGDKLQAVNAELRKAG